MSFTHKAGTDFGIDRGILVILALWIVATITLVIVLSIRGHLY